MTRLNGYVATLKDLVEKDPVDRDAVDEQVHSIDFMIDYVRRLVRGAEPMDSGNAARMRHHVAELEQDVATLLGMNHDECGKLDKQLKVAAATLRHIHSHTDRGGFRRWCVQPRRWQSQDELPGLLAVDEEKATSSGRRPPLPIGLILAVLTDSVVDGMLIGLASSVSTESGGLMAIATAIEMGFLGYSFACAVSKTGDRLISTAIIALPPIFMLGAASAASAGATYVEDSPAFVGLVAFALVALLFLVVDELLAEAHEKEESGDWRVSMWLYIGLGISIALDVIL
jgi:zinc transporter ZupT